MAGPTVQFFPTCLLDQFRPEAATAAERVLRDAGCDVRYDPDWTCCGQPAHNLGHVDEARRVARRLLASLDERPGPIVVPSGSCAAMMARHWPHLFHGTSDHDRALRVAARVREWSAYVQHDLAHVPKAHPRRETVTYHPACHGLRDLALEGEAETLLRAAGHTLVPLPRAEHCCGFGGAFSAVMPEASGAILADKLDSIEATKAPIVASLDQGCLMHMEGGDARRRGKHYARYRHVAELLARDRPDG